MTDAATDTRFGNAKDFLGFLIAGFAGVLNFVGLKSAEVGDVLRNESFSVYVVAALLLAALICAVLSVFARSHARPFELDAVILILAVVSASFWVVILVSQPSDSLPELFISISVTIILALVAWRLKEKPLKKEKKEIAWKDFLSLQSVLLLVAVILVSAAAYGGLRLETISQGASYAQISDSIKTMGNENILTVTISASKLTRKQAIDVSVQGVHRGLYLKLRCANALSDQQEAVACYTYPCDYAERPPNIACISLSNGVFAPDAAGAVRQTFSVQFKPETYDHLHLTAWVCNPDTKTPGQCNSKTQPSTLDQVVPAGPP